MPAADVVLLLERNAKRSEKLTPPNEAITIHVAKNRSGERSRLAFEFHPASARFVEV